MSNGKGGVFGKPPVFRSHARVMIFYDFENFRKSFEKAGFKIDYGKSQYMILEILTDFIGEKLDKSNLVRAYAYTGEFTDNVVSKAMKYNKEFGKELEAKREAQKRLFKRMSRFNLFELKTLPLRYENGKLFQKGVDVHLAVDLVSHAFRNNYDIAVVCSGDVDMLESFKIVKSLGKRIVVISHEDMVSRNIIKEADIFIDVSKLSKELVRKYEIAQ